MNKRLILGLIGLGLVGMTGGTFLAYHAQSEETLAYSHLSNLPTTIDLNDTSESTIRAYYSSLNSLSDAERSGTNLLKNLKPLLSNNQTYFSYDSGEGIWRLYEIIDRDWDLSPASEISGYDSSTNKIVGYTYHSSSYNPYVRSLYTNREVTNEARAWGDHTQSEWGINREHIWPKSRGFDTVETDSNGGARGDPMHLWAGNGCANNIHSNYAYGFVNKSVSYTDCGSKYSYLTGNLLGKSLSFPSYTSGSCQVFEPQDSDKGDIARAVFYMAARYNNFAGASSGIDANDPNLIIVDDVYSASSTGTSTPTSSFSMGVLRDLLAWNELDPVDDYEIHRNNLLYTNYTHNRNPFIDFPEWANAIWGSVALGSDSHSVASYSSNPVGAANPSTDAINGSSQSGGDPVSPSEYGDGEYRRADSIAEGDTVLFVAEIASSVLTGFSNTKTVYGTYATETIDRHSLDTDAGLEFTVGEGAVDGTISFYSSSLSKYLSWSSDNSLTTKATLDEDSSWTVSINNGDATISAYSDSTRKLQWNNTSGQYRFACYTSAQTAVQLYKKIQAPTITSIAVSAKPKVAYDIGDHFDPTGLTLTATYSDASTETISYATSAEEFSFTPSLTVSLTMEHTSITIGYAGLECQLKIQVADPNAETVFRKITSTDDLTPGDYLIVYETDSVVFDGSLDTLDVSANNVSVTLNSSKCTMVASSMFTYGEDSNHNGWLRSASGLYIGTTSDANGLSSSSSTVYGNTISFDQNGNVDIVSQGGAHLRFNSASDQKRFRYYKSSSYTNQKAIALYKVETMWFADRFLSGFTCDSTGASAPNFTRAWTDLKSDYQTMESSSKSLLHSGLADVSGNTLCQALARYDYVVAKYGYEDFLLREPSLSGALSVGQKGSSFALPMWILLGLACSGLSVFALAILRRKER